jgi:hypothetical protein
MMIPCYLGVFCLSKLYAQVLEERGLCYLVQRRSKLYRDADVIEVSRGQVGMG